MKQLGKITRPEQYFPSDELIELDDSVKAAEFFSQIPNISDGLVVPVLIKFLSMTTPIAPLWVYLKDINTKPDIAAMVSIFTNDDLEEMQRSNILEIIPIDKPMLYIHDSELYAFVPTSTGEVAVRRVRIILSENGLRSILKLEKRTIIDCYLSQLWSSSQQKYVSTCWSVETYEDEGKILWYPVDIEDRQVLEQFSDNDLREYPVGINQTVRIADENFVLRHDNELHSYLEKTFKVFRKGKEVILSGEDYATIPPRPKMSIVKK